MLHSQPVKSTSGVTAAPSQLDQRDAVNGIVQHGPASARVERIFVKIKACASPRALHIYAHLTWTTRTTSLGTQPLALGCSSTPTCAHASMHGMHHDRVS